MPKTRPTSSPSYFLTVLLGCIWCPSPPQRPISSRLPDLADVLQLVSSESFLTMATLWDPAPLPTLSSRLPLSLTDRKSTANLKLSDTGRPNERQRIRGVASMASQVLLTLACCACSLASAVIVFGSENQIRSWISSVSRKARPLILSPANDINPNGLASLPLHRMRTTR
jgi:hypothetical protein